MKNLFLLLTLCMVFGLRVSANDGVFYAEGNTLIPLQETQVELKKEVLKFFVVDYDYTKVDVYFEFNNPDEEKSVTVGFVAPPAFGDRFLQGKDEPFISDFTVNVNEKELEYKIKRLKETTFKLEKYEDIYEGGDYFVYYFPVVFKKGPNIIRHTYRFRANGSVDLDREFSYQITTGKSWANKQIDDFELQIHPDNGIFAVPARFLKNGDLADWKITGEGIIEENPREWLGENSPSVRLAHLNHGFLSFKAVNFKPDYDISFGEYNWGEGWIDIWCEKQESCREKDSLKKIADYCKLNPQGDSFADFTARDFMYLRNYFYASEVCLSKTIL